MSKQQAKKKKTTWHLPQDMILWKAIWDGITNRLLSCAGRDLVVQGAQCIPREMRRPHICLSWPCYWLRSERCTGKKLGYFWLSIWLSRHCCLLPHGLPGNQEQVISFLPQALQSSSGHSSRGRSQCKVLGCWDITLIFVVPSFPFPFPWRWFQLL